jgi:hypothetical protein
MKINVQKTIKNKETTTGNKFFFPQVFCKIVLIWCFLTPLAEKRTKRQ